VSPSLDDVDWPVRTERLLLRRLGPADADAAWAYRRDPEVAAWLTRLPARREVFDEWFTSREVQDSTLVVEHDGVVVGDLYLKVKDAWSQQERALEALGTEAELGWVLSPEHQGRGYAGEALAALFGICFERLGLRRVTAACFSANEPSWRLMERLGMRREEHALRESLHRSGRWLDGMAYGLLADEWRAREAGAPAS